ncbi:Transcriptional regulator, TetR family [Streptococcus pseudoporcinus]|uniref:Transcriptional regulator, TetR family n=1 Tax=Streptococcus pseudoporcinus TaxID=361101 RepID=A0A4U9Z991_9STRE|nr:TetR/AcrR family transcriptional regulator [Streptococcus pseudoporcinus]VTS35481.1 Transcriptional regulator, TetR family [Streptococcus pseudoporcinus]
MTDREGRRKHQIRETKDSFRQALFQLLDKQTLDQIRVSHLYEKAGYARRTFYRHYLGPEDILREEAEQLALYLFTSLAGLDNPSFGDFVEHFLTFWEKEKRFLQILWRNQLFSLVYSSWANHITGSPLVQKRQFKNSYQQVYVMGGMFHLLQAWVEKGCKDSPGQMRHITRQIIKGLHEVKE